MSENKTVFDRVDDVESKVDDVSTKMDNLSAKIDGLLSVKQTVTTPRQTENPQIALKRFIGRAKKEYMWLGTQSEFEYEKQTAFRLLWLLVGVGLFATIFSTIAFKLYSTFTLFENIWLIMMLCTIKYIRKAQYHYDCFDFSENSFFRFELDADGVLRCGTLKKKYKWFTVITCICVFCNIIVVWMEANVVLALIATLFELALGALSIYIFYFKALDFFCGYNHLRFTGRNDVNTQTVVLIYDPLMNKLYTEEDYLKQFPFCK